VKTWWAFILVVTISPAVQAQSCGSSAPLQLQILGSGGQDLNAGRAAASVLLWIHGRPRILIDTGPGAALRFVQAGASMADVDLILFTHLRAERSADLPALMQLASPATRTRALPIYGPMGNRTMPSTVTFVRALFDPKRGAWRHLGDLLSPLSRTAYKLEPHDLQALPPKLGAPRESHDEILLAVENETMRIAALPVTYGSTPTLIWRVETQGKRIVVSGGAHTGSNTMERMAQAADLLVMPFTAWEDTQAAKRSTESLLPAFARFAKTTGAKQLILAPRMHTTLGREEELTTLVRRQYAGAVTLANDMDCLTP